VFLLNYSY